MLTNGSLQGVTILKDKILEDNTGVACHPDLFQTNRCDSSNRTCLSMVFCVVFGAQTEILSIIRSYVSSTQMLR